MLERITVRDACEPTGFRSRQKLSSSLSLGHITRVRFTITLFISFSPSFSLSCSFLPLFLPFLSSTRDNVRSGNAARKSVHDALSLSLSLFVCLRLSAHRDLFLNFTVDEVIVGALFVEGRRPAGHRNESKSEASHRLVNYISQGRDRGTYPRASCTRIPDRGLFVATLTSPREIQSLLWARCWKRLFQTFPFPGPRPPYLYLFERKPRYHVPVQYYQVDRDGSSVKTSDNESGVLSIDPNNRDREQQSNSAAVESANK